MATSKRLPPMPNVKDLLGTHEQQSTSLLRGVNFEHVVDVLEECPVEELKKDDILISPGQPRRFIYLLLTGRLSVHLNKLMTDPIVILEPGEVAGEMSVVDHQPASAYVLAQEDSRVLVMDEKAIWALVDRYPIVARNLLYILSQHVRHGNVLIEASLLEKVSEQELQEFQPEGVNKAKGRVQAEVTAEMLNLYKTATSYVLDSINRVQEVAGEMSVVDHQPASAYVLAQEDSRVLVMDEKAIWALVDRYPIVARNLLYILSQHVRHGNVLIEASLLEKVSEQELQEFQPEGVNKAKGRVQAEVTAEMLNLYKTATSYVLDSINRALFEHIHGVLSQREGAFWYNFNMVWEL